MKSDPVESAVRTILFGLGETPGREGLRDTPRRVKRAMLEMTSGYKDNPATILSARFTAKTYDEMVVVRGIEFWSLCEHHLLPFHGVATVGYIPNGKVVGLSKVARLVHCFSRRLQIQERMTEEIAQALETHLKPKGVAVVVRATHLCMAMRGVKTPAEMVTSRLLGGMLEPTTRAEFLALEREPRSGGRG